jgi:DnaJ family protein C protein 1
LTKSHFTYQADYEIFDLVSELEMAEGALIQVIISHGFHTTPKGKDMDFYSLFAVSPTATTNEIARAYRRKSLEMQYVFVEISIPFPNEKHPSPDKNPGVKNIHERFARLGVIAQILRNQESRERLCSLNSAVAPCLTFRM